MIDREGPASCNVKVINPSIKSDYFIRKRRTRIRFQDIESLQDKLCSESGDHGEIVKMGYIEPGDGAQGKQRWNLNAGDLEDMFEAYSGKTEIMLWVYAPASECSHQSGRMCSRSPLPSEKEAKPCKSDMHAKKLVQVEEIADELEVQQGGAYKREQYSVWAHMINMRKHESRDIPLLQGIQGKKEKTLHLTPAPALLIHLRFPQVRGSICAHNVWRSGIVYWRRVSSVKSNIKNCRKIF